MLQRACKFARGHKMAEWKKNFQG